MLSACWFVRLRINASAVAVLLPLVCCPTTRAVPTTQQWVDRLSSPDPAERTAAQTALQNAGMASIAPLQETAAKNDPESSQRARLLLRRIQIHSLPNLPQDAAATAENYLSETNPIQRKVLLDRLFKMQPLVSPLLARLVVLETDEDLRRQMLYRLRTDYRDSVTRWLAIDQDPRGLLQLLNGASTMWGQEAAADYAAGLNTAGLLDQQIQIEEAEKSNGDADESNRAARQLCFFYRLKNQFGPALKAARDAHESSLVFLVLGDQQNWQAAADEPDDRWHDVVVTAGIRAGYQRLAGQSQKATETMNALLPTITPDTDDSFIPSKLFMINDQPDRGLELMAAQHPSAVFKCRVARGEIALALQLARNASPVGDEATRLHEELINLRHTLGELPENKLSPTSQETETPPDRWHLALTDLSNKAFEKAAGEFAQLWETDPANLASLYLQGYAKKLAGDAAQGSVLMQTAEMIPLGDPLPRIILANQLDEAGLSDIATQQRNIALHTGARFDDVGLATAYSTMAALAMQQKQWQAASQAMDHFSLINLSPQVQLKDPEELLLVPALGHLLKARWYREQNNLTDAMHELQIYQQYLPASSELVLEWVPALDDLGEHQKADALFETVFKKLKPLCDQYSRSIAYQNELAWMCACCSRQLDAAQTASEKAVALSPSNWQMIDTLAEIHFRKGERQRAIDLEKRAVALCDQVPHLSNDQSYLARQLKRFQEAAVPSTTQPGPVPE